MYQAKGFNPEGVPLPGTLDNFGLLDDNARQLLADFYPAGAKRTASTLGRQ
ncbi:MAG: hypothetical protein SV487_09550 [Thermodesulfobacteriota bacterium]|nr:hypothetical protein [Thermodesulfobacteriota bacterium]